MAGTRRAANTADVTGDQLPPETSEEILDQADASEVEKIEGILSANDLSGGSIRLERKGPTDQAYQFVGKFRISDGFDLDFVRKVYGGGDYRAKTFRSNGQMGKAFEFSIDYRFKGTMDVEALPKAGSSDSQVPALISSLKSLFPQQDDGKSNDRMMQMFKAMGDSQQAMMMFMMQSQQQNSQQQMAMMTGMMTAMGQAMGNGGKTPDMTPVLIEMIKSAGTNRTGDKGSDLPTLIEAMRSLKELTTGVPATAPEEEKETAFDKILKYGGPVVAALLTKTPLQMPGVPAPAGAPLLPPPNQEIDMPTDQQLPVEVKAYIGMIIGAAAKNSDTAIYADLIDDALNNEQADILCGVLQQPDWIEKLAQTDARVLQFKPWFSKLREELLELYGVTATQPDATEHVSQPPVTPGASFAGGPPVITIPGRTDGPAAGSGN